MKRVLFVQNGDFREAYRRFADGQAPTYRDQKRSVDFVAGLAPDWQVTTAAFGPVPYEEEIAPNLWTIGLHRKTLTARDIDRMFELANPSHVVMRTPHREILQAVQARDLFLLPVFADLFAQGGVKAWLRNRRLKRVLLRSRAPCFSNHSLNASRSLERDIGLPPSRIVPWDWNRVPSGGDAKSRPADPARPTAFFAGGLTASKGVGDCIEALALMHGQGVKMSMSFAGKGETGPWTEKAATLGVADHVRFLGVVSNDQVRHEMRAHDVVIVPSRHSYPEGLPNTIYEGLASRSPLILSDHPAFSGRLRPEHEVLEFKAADPASLAACLSRVCRDPALYRHLSENAPGAHESLYIGMEWSDLIETFLADPENQNGWVEKNALSTWQARQA